MIKKTLLLLFLLSFMFSWAQIEGIVYDSQSKRPLVGASIQADTESTISNEEGAFKLLKPSNRIIISYIGYQTDTLFPKSSEFKYHILLYPVFQEMEAAIVLGHFNKFEIQKAPSSIGYIDDLVQQNQDMINFSGNLNQIPGVFVQSGTYNTNRITIRGIGSRTPYGTNRIKAYYQGIPLTSGDGTTVIEDINSSLIGSVQILKGSKSALYGSGLGGLILINKPQLENGLKADVKTSVGSFQSLNTSAKIQYRDQGFFVSGEYGKARSNGWRENNQLIRDYLALDFGYITNKNRFDINILAIQTKAHIPSSLNKHDFDHSPEKAAANWLAVKGFEEYQKLISGLRWEYLIHKNVDNTFQTFFLMNDAYESRPFNILDEQAMKWGFRNITSFKLNQYKIQLGFEQLIEHYNWSIYETNLGNQANLENKFSEKRNPLSVFIHVQYHWNEQFFVEAGFSLNFLNYSLYDEFNSNSGLSGDYHYPAQLSPFIGINGRLAKGIRIYSSISHGFSAPSVEETLMPEGNINPNLKPETGINAEIGVRYETDNQRLRVDANIYHIWVNNLLVTKRESEAVFYGENAGKTSHSGFEIMSKIGLNNSESRFPISLQMNYHFIRAVFTDFVDDQKSYSGNYLPGIPNQNLWFSGIINSKFGLFAELQYQFVGKQYLNDANDETYNNYQLFHYKMSYAYQFSFAEVVVNAGIRNLFNQKYASMILVNAPSFGGAMPRYYYPGMPRYYFLGLQIRL